MKNQYPDTIPIIPKLNAWMNAKSTPLLKIANASQVRISRHETVPKLKSKILVF